MRLLIAIPCGDSVRYEFSESLCKLIQHLSDIRVDYEVKFLAGSLIYTARDELAITAINDGYTHILWLDSDMQFAPSLFDELWAAKKPFVSGIYRSRRSPYAICLFDIDHESDRVLSVPDEIFEIAACGFGCVLMETAVAEEIKRRAGLMFNPTPHAGEDIAFCRRYRKLGGHIYAVPTAVANHISYVPLRVGDPSNLVAYMELR